MIKRLSISHAIFDGIIVVEIPLSYYNGAKLAGGELLLTGFLYVDFIFHIVAYLKGLGLASDLFLLGFLSLFAPMRQGRSGLEG